MAKFVIAGAANCPYFARAELLADSLQTNLPDFRIHKIVKPPDEWKNWLSEICKKNGWAHTSSPLVWRELIDRGGKGVLIGGSNEFQEYAAGYYGISSSMLSSDMTTIGSENMQMQLSVREEEEYIKSMSKPLHVCITNAASHVAYHMLCEIASGEVIGKETELSFHLLVEEETLELARGVSMEVIDMAYPLLREVTVTTDPCEALNRASLVIILDDMSKRDNEEWYDWIKRCGNRYTNYGTIISKWASFDCKILVAGCGAVNLGAYVIKHEAKDILRQNIVVPSRLSENRAKAAIARCINVNSSGVVNVIMWGNGGGTMHLDLSIGEVHGCDGAIWGPPSYSRPIKEMVHDDKWLQTEYLESLKTHKNTIEGALRHSAAVSEAHSVVATIAHWWNGAKKGETFSMGVISDGCYEIPDGLVFSVPVKFEKGSWQVVEDINVTSELKEELLKIVDELEREIEVIFPSPHNKNSAVEFREGGVEEIPDKVFGTKEEQYGSLGFSGNNTPSEDGDIELARSLPLSRIVEESETDTKEGSTVTER